MAEEFDKHAVNTPRGLRRTPPKYLTILNKTKANRIKRFFLSADCACYNRSNFCSLRRFISTSNKRSVSHRWEFIYYFSLLTRVGNDDSSSPGGARVDMSDPRGGGGVEIT